MLLLFIEGFKDRHTFKTSFICLKFSSQILAKSVCFVTLLVTNECIEVVISCNVFYFFCTQSQLFRQTDYACRFSKVFFDSPLKKIWIRFKGQNAKANIFFFFWLNRKEGKKATLIVKRVLYSLA